MRKAGPFLLSTLAFLLFRHHFFDRCRIVQENPFDDRQRQTAIFDQVVVELAKPEIIALAIFVTAEQVHDLPFADDVADLLGRT